MLEDIVQCFLATDLSASNFAQFFQDNFEVFGDDVAAHAHVHGFQDASEGGIGTGESLVVAGTCNDYVVFCNLWDVGGFYQGLLQEVDVYVILGTDPDLLHIQEICLSIDEVGVEECLSPVVRVQEVVFLVIHQDKFLVADFCHHIIHLILRNVWVCHQDDYLRLVHLLEGALDTDVFHNIVCLANAGGVDEAEGDTIRLSAPPRLNMLPAIVTEPYPGFPTDAQSLFLALAATAEGTGTIRETIFTSRFKVAAELCKMGADIKICRDSAHITGVSTLTGTKVAAPDLRGGAALVIAALAAKGTTEIENVCYIDRGYEHLEENLTRLGAVIRREA